ncbi:hypothetical protein GBAR_LOCUS25249 [Geodia barretti]|uniref:Uncharacterized protein n=1 Tax=Geodia barretti TaxID=519541 RepID=A0AA35XAS2_GEOBA|nr:hypothetical protein GBAR_LOCUS25249 [Geodia barretti]
MLLIPYYFCAVVGHILKIMVPVRSKFTKYFSKFTLGWQQIPLVMRWFPPTTVTSTLASWTYSLTVEPHGCITCFLAILVMNSKALLRSRYAKQLLWR